MSLINALKQCFMNIPITNQDAYFRVLERYQFKAVLCNNGRSLIKSTNEEVILHKRFFDGSKIRTQ